MYYFLADDDGLFCAYTVTNFILFCTNTQKLGMSDEMASELKMRLFVPVKGIRLAIVLLFIGGLCCIFGGLLFVILSYRKTVS